MATLAHERASENADEFTVGQTDSIVAMLFSVVTLEAFIGEFAELAHISQSHKMHRIADVLDELEDNRAQLGLKFLVLSELLGGKTYSKGSQPYQDFRLLLEVRNKISHKKPEFLRFTEDKIVSKFITRKLCRAPARTGPITLSDLPHWLRDISTPAAARWACNVVARMIKTLSSSLPDDAEEIRSLCVKFDEVPPRFQQE